MLRNTVAHHGAKRGAATHEWPPSARSWVERVTFWGQDRRREVVVRGVGGEVVEGATAIYDADAAKLTVRQPKVRIGEEWTIELVSGA